MRTSKLLIPRVNIDWSQLSLPEHEIIKTNNGGELYLMQNNRPGICSFEIIFKNGRICEHKKLVSRMTAHLIQEGTRDLDSEKVADTIDYHGAQLSIYADLDFTVVSMGCLQKHFDYLSGFVIELLLNPAYRETDLERAKKFLNSQLQHQLIEPDYRSYREFTAMVYGQDSTYGYNTTEELIRNLNTSDLHRYREENYTSDRLQMFYCGELNEPVRRHLEALILKFSPAKKIHTNPYVFDPAPVGNFHIPIEKCVQTSLKFGTRCLQKQHPDFFGLYILNIILGDYFGSRLMKNLREDKGYTYDIHSTLDAQVHDGCFYISAELSPEHLENAMYWIKEEIKKLREELIPAEELELVKNYICGNIMRQMDGPLQSMIFIKILLTEYGTTEVFKKLMKAVLGMNAENLRSMAQKYLDPDKMIQLTAGG